MYFFGFHFQMQHGTWTMCVSQNDDRCKKGTRSSQIPIHNDHHFVKRIVVVYSQFSGYREIHCKTYLERQFCIDYCACMWFNNSCLFFDPEFGQQTQQCEIFQITIIILLFGCPCLIFFAIFISYCKDKIKQSCYY